MMTDAVVFSGGTACRDTARELARRRRSITYLITTFDSGGSSQALRKVFPIPAVGDLRNRLLAIARHRQIAQALNERLHGDPEQAKRQLTIINFEKWLAHAPQDARHAIESDLRTVLAALPESFDAAKASLGNLAITGAWLRLNRNLLAAVNRYENILGCVGRVLPICESNLQLAAKLIDGQTIVQQHLFASLPAPVADIFLVNEAGASVTPDAEPEALAAIATARAVFYPMGSFCSSILPNFLPRHVGTALGRNPAPKIFIPNVGSDRELHNMSILEQAHRIVAILARNYNDSLPMRRNDHEQNHPVPGTAPRNENPQLEAMTARPLEHSSPMAQAGRRAKFLDAVLVDPAAHYPGGISPRLEKELATLGARLLRAPIAPAGDRHDPQILADVMENWC